MAFDPGAVTSLPRSGEGYCKGRRRRDRPPPDGDAATFIAGRSRSLGGSVGKIYNASHVVEPSAAISQSNEWLGGIGAIFAFGVGGQVVPFVEAARWRGACSECPHPRAVRFDASRQGETMNGIRKPQPDASSPVHEANAPSPASQRRRRLLQGGLAVTPVVAILKSREVLASTSGALQCRAVSAYLSGSSHLSHHPEGEICTGRTPGYWQTHPEAWPKSTLAPGTCDSKNPCNSKKDWNDDGAKMIAVWPLAAGNYKSATMMQVLWMRGNEDGWQAGAHLVAAALNNLTGKVSDAILPWARIVAMGNAILGGSEYAAAPGVSWNGEELVAYLKQTMPL